MKRGKQCFAALLWRGQRIIRRDAMKRKKQCFTALPWKERREIRREAMKRGKQCFTALPWKERWEIRRDAMKKGKQCFRRVLCAATGIFLLAGILSKADGLVSEAGGMQQTCVEPEICMPEGTLRLGIDTVHRYRDMDTSYSQGYIPRVESGIVHLVVPFVSSGELQGGRLSVELDLGKNAPFVYANYRREVPKESYTFAETEGNTEAYVFSCDIALGDAPAGGSYPVTVRAVGYSEGGQRARLMSRIYITVEGGNGTAPPDLNNPGGGTAPPDNSGNGTTPPDNPGNGTMSPDNSGNGTTPPDNPGNGMVPPDNSGNGTVPPDNSGDGTAPPDNSGNGTASPSDPGGSLTPPDDPSVLDPEGPSQDPPGTDEPSTEVRDPVTVEPQTEPASESESESEFETDSAQNPGGDESESESECETDSMQNSEGDTGGVYYGGGGGYSGGAAEPAETVHRQPRLIPVSDSLSDTPLSAGEEYEFTAKFQNANDSESVYNLLVTVKSEREDIRLGNGSFYFGKVRPQETIALPNVISVGKTAAAGSATLTFDLAYEDARGTAYTGTSEIRLEIIQPLQVLLDGFRLAPQVYSTETVEGTFSIRNLGNAEVYNVQVSLDAPGLFAVGDAFVGNLEPGTSGEGTLQIYVGNRTMTSLSDPGDPGADDAYGRTSGTVTMTCEDAYGEKYSQTQEFSTEILKPQIIELTVEKEETRTNQWGMAVIVGVTFFFLLILSVMGWRLRKSRNALADLLAAQRKERTG